VRYLSLLDLLDRPRDDPEVLAAQREVMTTGPVPRILAAQHPEGYWAKLGPGYSPKYTGTVWQVIFLAQLGADGVDGRVRAGCEYVLEHSRARCGGFSIQTSSTLLVHCLEGNLVAALIDLGWWGDERLSQATDWLARSITGEGIAPAEDKHASVRYVRSGNSGPEFLCSANNHLPCGWGATKAMLALSKVPECDRTPAIQAAIREGAAFLLGRDPAVADYPMGFATKPSGAWFQLGYPLGYQADVLQNLEALTALGYADDPRLDHAREWLCSKQSDQGRWKLKHTFNGKVWADVEHKGRDSKWVTLRALRVLMRTKRKESNAIPM